MLAKVWGCWGSERRLHTGEGRGTGGFGGRGRIGKGQDEGHEQGKATALHSYKGKALRLGDAS